MVLLQRLDYVAIGPPSHYCFDHKTFGGFVFPTLPRVVQRPPSGPLVSGPTAVLIQVDTDGAAYAAALGVVFPDRAHAEWVEFSGARLFAAPRTS